MSLLPHQTNLILKMNQDPFDPKFETNEPVEYILGKAEFRDSIFNINRNVLIPRVETEEIIDLAIQHLESNGLINESETIRFCDVATGSGAIGVSFAKELGKRSIDYLGYLSDISDEALEVAKTNVDSLLEDEINIETLKSDLLASYPNDIKFNVIFANLPYIPTERLDTLDASVRDFEPLLALDGGIDGLNLIRRLVAEAKDFLDADGILLLEVDDTHTIDRVPQFDMGNSSQPEIKVVLDQFGKNRFWVVRY